MATYSVSEVLEIIKNLAPEEKVELKSHLPSLLDSIVSSATPQTLRTQSQSIGNVSINGNSNAFGANLVGGDATITQTSTQATVQNTTLQEVLSLLAKLKQDIAHSNRLNPIEKATIEVSIKMAEAELQKSQPDKSLVDQAIAAFRKGIAGIEELAEPVMRVSSLIAKAWAVL
jgi:hypothetical protein